MPSRPCARCAWPTRRWVRLCTRSGAGGTGRPASSFRTGPAPCTKCMRRWSRTSRWACTGAEGAPGPRSQPCGARGLPSLPGELGPAQSVSHPPPTLSCWEPQPLKTGSRMAFLKPSRVSNKETSKCGYSQEISKVGPREAIPSRERREMGGRELICAPSATISLFHLSGLNPFSHLVSLGKGEMG